MDTAAATDLATILQDLRASEREALYLHHIEGRTAEEIGKLTQSHRNTILSALKKLQVLPKG